MNLDRKGRERRQQFLFFFSKDISCSTHTDCNIARDVQCIDFFSVILTRQSAGFNIKLKIVTCLNKLPPPENGGRAKKIRSRCVRREIQHGQIFS